MLMTSDMCSWVLFRQLHSFLTAADLHQEFLRRGLTMSIRSKQAHRRLLLPEDWSLIESMTYKMKTQIPDDQ